jgi:hypothetical protein
MVEQLDNALNEAPPEPLEILKVEDFEGIGEITIGVGSDKHILMTAIVLMDNPQANKFLLAQKLKLSDRLTKTKIFPRTGMALPDGEVYIEPLTDDKKEG